MKKEMIIARLNKVAEFGGCQGYHYTVKINEWNKYGKSRTYFSIVETRERTKHFKEKKYGYFDNQTGEYVPDKYGDLSGDTVYDFGGNHKIDLTERNAEESADSEAKAEKINKSDIMKSAGAILKIKGIKAIAGASKDLRGYYSGRYLQVNYNRSTGETWYNEHVSLGQNSWTQYEDGDIINCGTISEPVTMAQLREMIERAVMRVA